APQPHTTPAHSAADASMLVWVEHPGSSRPPQPPRNEDSTVAPNVPERTLRFQACRLGGRSISIGDLPHPRDTLWCLLFRSYIVAACLRHFAGTPMRGNQPMIDLLAATAIAM